MIFTDEKQILDKDFRAQVIKEIVLGQENIARKNAMLRRHEIYRDKNSKWVMNAIEKEGFKAVTVEQMRNRASNISIARKIVNKLARTYVGGVDREAADETSQVSIDLLADELDFDTKMKKSDRYRQLFKNTMVFPVPVLSAREPGKYKIIMRVLAPWEYDVIEDPNDRTQARVVVLTQFLERGLEQVTDALVGAGGRRVFKNVSSSSDGRDQIIADSAADEGKGADGSGRHRQFIFWSDSYHLTCYKDGTIVPGTGEPDNSNPIGMLPPTNVASDQDGHFWAEGGDDVVEGSILINKKMTDINFISFVQGWGQMVVAAKNIPKQLVGGPDNAFLFEIQDGDPDPKVYFASSNPPILDWLETVDRFLRMLLTTNDLSSSDISGKLDANNAQSGIAMIIESADVISSAKDNQKLFQDKEPEIWEVVRRWHELYSSRNALVKAQQVIPAFKDSNVKLKFVEVKPPVSEKEKLENMKLRKDLGIATLVDLIKLDNPDLSEEQAEAKAKEIAESNKAAQEKAVGDLAKNITDNGGIKNGNQLGDQGDDASGSDKPADAKPKE